MKQRIFTLYLVLFSLLGIGSNAYAGTVTAIATGNWSATGTWDTGVVPTSSDDVVIPNTFTVTIDAVAAAACSTLTVQNGGIVSLNNTLYVSNININSGGVFKGYNANTSNKSVYWGYSAANTPKTGDFSITNNGQFGGSTLGAEDGVAIFFSDLATNLTIDGSSIGTCYIGRFIPGGTTVNAASNDMNLNIKQNLYISNGNSGTGIGFSLQNNKAFTTTTTRYCTIFPGYTVTINPTARFHTAASACPTNAEGNFVYNIYGTLDLATNNTTYFDLYTTSSAGSTHSITVNLGNGTDYAVLKLGRNINLKRYYEAQAITLNWNNPNSKVVFGGNGGITLNCSGYYNGTAYVDDARVFPSSIRNISFENASTTANLFLPVKVSVTESLDMYGYGQKLYVGTVSDGNAKTVTMGKLFNLNNNAYVVTAVSTPLTTESSTTLGAAGTWVKGATLTDASGNSYYCDEFGLTAGAVNYVVGSTLGSELSGAPINVTGNVNSALTSGQTARFALATIGGNVTNGAGTLTFGKSSTVTGNLNNAGTLTNVSGASLVVKGSLTNSGTVTLASGLTTAALSNSGTIAVGANQLTISGALSGAGTINASLGTLAFGGTAEQILLASSLTSATVSNLTVNAGSKLTTSGDFTASAINILSDATNGTGTLINGGTVTNSNVNVRQYLTGAGGTTPSTRFWYFSSPLTDASSNAIDVVTANPLNKLWSFSETAYGYAQILDNATPLTRGLGYVVRLGDNKTVQLVGTTLNNGDINITATRTGTTLAKRGYNLLGNPYPSYLNINAAFNSVSTTGLESSIWYRSFNSTSNIMAFDTYNAFTGEGISLGSDGASLTNYLSPMQAFWVRASLDDVSGNLALTNAMRSHQASTIKLRATEDSVCTPKIRLQISNGRGIDQTLIGIYPEAKDAFEKHDSHKMFNDNDSIPEIYTFAGNEQVAINGLAPFEGNKEMALGFKTGKPGIFTIKAMEMNNLDAGTKVILKDMLQSVSQDLTSAPEYTFTSDAASTADRFTLTIQKVATKLDEVQKATFEIRNIGHQQMEIALQNLNGKQAEISVYSTLGQKVMTTTSNSSLLTLNRNFKPGVYVVKVNADGYQVSKKIIINQ